MNIALIGKILELYIVAFLRELWDINLPQIVIQKRRIIGLDIGDKTVGVAVSDSRAIVATSIGLINRRNDITDCAALSDKIKPYNVVLVVFGWPLQMDGTSGSQCEKNLKFVKCFESFVKANAEIQDLTFAKWDERCSTKAVTDIMIEADLSRKRRKEVVDKTAAAYILQGALDFLNRNCV